MLFALHGGLLTISRTTYFVVPLRWETRLRVQHCAVSFCNDDEDSLSGKVSEENEEEAFRLAQVATLQHERGGFRWLGRCFEEGIGCEEDFKLARENLLIAVGMGSVLHQNYAPIALQDILEMRGGLFCVLSSLLLFAKKGLNIKLGQMMTTRADYAPPTFMKALSVLQDSVPSRPFSEIAEEMRREMGVEDLKQIFRSIEEKPLGAATIGQVHGAELREKWICFVFVFHLI